MVAIGAELADLAKTLGFASVAHASMAMLREALVSYDALVVVAPIPVVVRAIVEVGLAPKRVTPAIVALDSARRYCVVLTGAHRGANDLAEAVSRATGAVAVVTTSADLIDAPALDELPALGPEPLPARLQQRLNDGAALSFAPRPGLAISDWLARRARPGRAPAVEVNVGESRGLAAPRIIARTVVVGVGLEQRATADDLRAAIDAALEEADLEPAAVAALATIDRRRLHPALGALGLPIVGYEAAVLREVAVPTPSPIVERAVHTPSVAEAAALRLAGPDATLVLPKRIDGPVTVAVAVRDAPLGEVTVVGLGPGSLDLVTPRARGAIANADVVIAYHGYLDQAQPLIGRHALQQGFALGAERERAMAAVARAEAGARVVVLASGDPGIYALATLVHEVADGRVPVSVVPGVTASLATAARAGAILAHDHAVISLSDLLTPWETIQQRLEAAARADLTVVLYNPRSGRRGWQLEKALAILAAHRPPTTPVLVGRNVERVDEHLELGTLDDLDVTTVDMTSIVIVGQSATRVLGGLAVTPRGYQPAR
ncbi:precorrin-3B C17-methyltransferase [Acidimicrobium ferrooxidans DSM 10331]|uniref:Precorrin-3B C17-methyltransferase n=1 Tax=Acidimicrobium ferrooxidans (strain DSM 10331 / JCM 15462 / NBRC 103882 / ICP) TaxID=525909 RepID=C7LYE1_ACIFD|nr:precorrin-3B C(17)-methyltransferase [Acidimicrobium ferrooxidans]ACU53749.1 precorrin-3B C17-methyltransferase [Acidimicrobium ferrooxidans DSM 10331]